MRAITRLLPIAFCLMLLVACATSSQRTAFNTLATTGKAVNDSYLGYLDSVYQGVTRTNGVPDITQKYRIFQSVYNGAVMFNFGASNSVPVTADVAEAAINVTSAIASEKASK